MTFFLQAKLVDSLKAENQSLRNQLNAKTAELRKLERQAGVGHLDIEGVRAILQYRSEQGDWTDSECFSILENLLNCRIATAKIALDDKGDMIITGVPHDSSTLYEIRLPRTIHYDHLSQIADVLSPLRFENLSYLLEMAEDETFFILPGELIQRTAEDGVEVRQIVLLPPESESLVVIRENNVTARRIDFGSYLELAEQQMGATPNPEQLSELRGFHAGVVSMYYEFWHEQLPGVEFTED